MGRALRADAERSVRAILEAAERVLAEDPNASMEQIAEAAGLTRITVHRRFANRQALLEALSVSAKQQLMEAVAEARPDSAPALVALYRVTANLLRVKNSWRFTLLNHGVPNTGAAAVIWADLEDRTLELLRRAQAEGLLDPAADLEWTRQVYYALLSEVLKRHNEDPDPDALSALVIDTLLHGAGPRSGPAEAKRPGPPLTD
jgi:AcrR family transcriptional regulator